MKNYTKKLFALTGVVLLAVAGSARSAEMLEGQSLVFEPAEFTPKAEKPQEMVATKRWAIFSRESPRSTELWDANAMMIAPSGDIGNRLCSTDSGYGGPVFAVWRCEVPEGMIITKFNWRVGQMILSGAPRPAGDDDLAWEYSTDGVRWIPFFERENRARDENHFVVLNNLSFAVELNDPRARQLFIRLAKREGPIAGDSSYMALVSNSGRDGGESPHTAIVVTVTPAR